MRFYPWIGLVGLLAILVSIVGPAEFVVAQPGESTVQGSRALVTYHLEGIWAGIGYLDEEKLAEKLQKMEPGAERDELVNKAATFLSIHAAIEFGPSGNLETDLEVTDADGKVLREPTIGKWKVIERRENRVLVELDEKLVDETQQTSRRLIQFYEDGDHIAVLLESDPVLTEFNPLVVMERVPAAEVAQAVEADSNIGAIKK